MGTSQSLLGQAIIPEPATSKDNLIRPLIDGASGLVIRQHSTGQSSPLIDLQDPLGNSIGGFDSSGAVVGGSLGGAVILAPNTPNRNLIQPTADANSGLIVQAFSPTQSADLAEFRTSTGAVVGRVLPTGVFSCPDSGTNSERYGLSSAATALEATALGFTATASASYATAVGTNATGNGTNATAIGRYTTAGLQAVAMGGTAQATATRAIAIGQSSNNTSVDSVAVGASSSINGVNTVVIGAFAQAGVVSVSSSNGSTVIGRGASSTSSVGMNCLLGYAASDGVFGPVICLGAGATATANNQLVIGGVNSFGVCSIQDVYIGKGVTHASPAGLTLNSTGGVGSNIAGGNITVAGGRSTGNAKGGDVLIQGSAAGGAGTTLNALATLAIFTADSKFGIFTAAGTPVAQQAGASAAGIAAITDANAKAAVSALQNALHALGWITAPA